MADTSKPCYRCKASSSPHTLRNSPACSSCYIAFVDQKIARRLTAVHKNTTLQASNPANIRRRFLAGLSLGPCSSVLAHALSNAVRRYRDGKSAVGVFEVEVVHVDTSLALAGNGAKSPAEEVVESFQSEYPLISFQCVPLERVLEVRTVDWATLPVGSREHDPTTRLKTLFQSLPSISSRADVLRLLIRHLLLHLAFESNSTALVLGNSTTTLAALTLAEVANGRGFSVPWHVDDGNYPVTMYDPLTPGTVLSRTEFPIYYPLRELFTGEASTYIDLVPSLAALTPKGSIGANAEAAVVSHKDLSISEVMARYFAGVEGPYAGIVTNVVRTTGKLERASASASNVSTCGLCGIALDEQGDQTWAGELGEESAGPQRLCYGCKRSVNG